MEQAANIVLAYLAYNGGVRTNSEFDSGTDAWQVESSLGASPSGQNPIQAQIINDGGTDRLQIQCMGLSSKNIMWSTHVGVYNNICHKVLVSLEMVFRTYRKGF